MQLINNLTTPISTTVNKVNTIKQALKIVMGFTDTEKMPSLSYSIPADACRKGAKLRKIKGSVCSKCYALKGNYKRYPNIIKVQYKRLASIDHPQWVESMSYVINNQKKIKTSGVFRWHDSGDLQGVEHLDKILQVVKNTPDIMHWLPTKESQLIKNYRGKIPSNIVIRLSGSMIDNDKPPIYNNTSTVTTDPLKATCKSYENDGKCGDCRKCWDKEIKNISYLIH